MEQAQQTRRVQRAFEYIDKGITATGQGMRRTPISHYTSAEWQAREVATLCKTYPRF